MLSFGYSTIPQQYSAGIISEDIANKYSVQLPKGLSFNIFKAPTLASLPYNNFGTAYSAPRPTYPQNPQNSRSRTSSATPTYRADAPTIYEHEGTTRSRLPSQNYSTHANTSTRDDVLIYQTSATSNGNIEFTDSSDISPAPSELYSLQKSPAASIDDVSSTMASSSTETLQSTLIDPEPRTTHSSSTLHSQVNPDEHATERDNPSPSTPQIPRQHNISKLSTQLDINNPIYTNPTLARPSDQAPVRLSRVEPSENLSRLSIPDTSRGASVRDCSSSSTSSSSSESSTTVEFPAADKPRRPLPSPPDVLQEDISRVDNSKEVVGFIIRPQESRPRTRAMTTDNVPLPLKVETSRRSVRWKEELVCPSPLPRRKGWFNRRGDQLWTNDGLYKPAESGAEFPDDLQEYPDPNTGWMNELGVRIDMHHRLIPKTPPRPALKQYSCRPESFRRATV